MTTELEPRAAVNPATGERFALDQPEDQLVLALADAQEMRHRLGSFEAVLSRELLERMDRAANWTIHAGAYKVAGRSPEPPDEYDVDRLRAELTKLVEAGVIHAEAAKAAIKTEVTYKPVTRGLNALRKLGAAVAEVIDSCKRDVDREEYARRRKVRVSVDA